MKNKKVVKRKWMASAVNQNIKQEKTAQGLRAKAPHELEAIPAVDDAASDLDNTLELQG